jgi:hypothetical protein
MVWTSDRLARKDEGKAVDLECVMTILEEVSVRHELASLARATQVWGTLAGCAAHLTGQDGILSTGAAVE